MSDKVRICLECSLTYKQQLSTTIDPNIEDHWNKKIMNGIIPTEVFGKVTTEQHLSEMLRLLNFEVRVIKGLFENEWRREGQTPTEHLYYFGIGGGEVLREVIKIVNANNIKVVACDISSHGCEIGEKVIEEIKREQPSGLKNNILHADIESATEKRYIKKHKRPTKLVASRVLDILDKEENDWLIKPPSERKMARTARKMGKLLSFLDILLIHPRPEDNANVIWGDTTPHRIEEVVHYMREGLKAEIKFKTLGTESFHGHVYTAVLIQRA